MPDCSSVSPKPTTDKACVAIVRERGAAARLSTFGTPRSVFMRVGRGRTETISGLLASRAITCNSQIVSHVLCRAYLISVIDTFGRRP